VTGEGEAFHRTSPDGDRDEKADLHSPAQSNAMFMRSERRSESWRLFRSTQYADARSGQIPANSFSAMSFAPLVIDLLDTD
jgi:hypothetical protein